MNILRKLNTVDLTKKSHFFISERSILSPAYLRINDFFTEKENVLKNFQKDDISAYKKKLKNCVEYEKDIMVFPSDIYKLVYLADSKEDLDVIHKLLIKLKSQKFLKVENFNYGSHVMKLHYIMNMPQEAISLVKNPILYQDFEEGHSFTIFLDMLFENELFEDIIKMFEYKKLNKNSFREGILHMFFFAACYKLNTRDAFEKALRFWQVLQSTGYKFSLRIRHFFSALSINQNEYYCAMDILHVRISDTLSDNFKVIIFAKTRRFSDALYELNKFVQNESTSAFVLREVITIVENEIKNSQEGNIVEFNSIKENIINMKKINEMSIEEILFQFPNEEAQNL